MHVRNKEINFFTAVNNFSFNQDTTIIPPIQQHSIDINSELDSIQKHEKDTILSRPIPKIDFNTIDSILRKSEERETQILKEQQAVKTFYVRKVDTTEIMFKEFGIVGFPLKENLKEDPFSQNFLYNNSNIKPAEKPSKQSVFIEDENSNQSVITTTGIKESPVIKNQNIGEKLQFDWITILLLVSFLLLGWVRLFNKKYLLSLIKSVLSYQESNTLYREKNSLMERASFLINLLFVSNLSLFILQILNYFNVQINVDNYIFYLIVISSLVGLYIFRLLATSFIGYVFLKPKAFSEYFHNVNIYTKITGLFLFPIVVILQFLSFKYVGLIIYIGIIFTGILYLLLILRAFQIIIRKNVSIFYMILYLCAFEFVPFLIIYKLILSFR